MDGVKIDGETRTADDGALFTVQTWSAGTKFPIHFELIITADTQEAGEENILISSFATALQALANGDIPMGARKNRGYGHCEINQWQVRTYDMQKYR